MEVSKKKEASLAQRASGPLSNQKAPLSIGTLEHALLKEFPAADAEPWDRTGLLVGDPTRTVTNVAVALDVTVPAIKQAAERGANVLVTHHPAYLQAPEVFAPCSSTALSSGALVWAAIENGVALMSFHTALDVSEHAQRVLPSMLNLQFEKVVEPLAHQKLKGYGQLCGLASSDAPLTLGQLAARCTSVFARQPRVWGDFATTIKHVVTCTGSAGGVAQAALLQKATCLICGEIKYHEALALSEAGLAIIELGHDTSELPLAAVLAAAVQRAGVRSACVGLLDQAHNWTYPEALRV